MPGLPPTLYSQIREALLACDEISNPDQWRAILRTSLLRPFVNSLKIANNPNTQVDYLIGDLTDRQLATGENGLVLLLELLASRYDPSDTRHDQLENLAKTLQFARTDSGTSRSLQNKGIDHHAESRGRNFRPLPASQQAVSSEIQHRYALLVGVRDYVDPNFKPLPHTVHDVVALEKVLTAAGYAVRCLHSDQMDDKLKPTRDNIWGELENLAAQTGSGDLLLVHFGGHGHLQDNKAYLITSQTRRASLQRTAIDLDEFTKTLTNAPAQARILILDACHSGIGRSATGMDPDFERHVYLEAEGTATLAACRQQQVAYEHDQSPHGAFTYFLLEGLRGGVNKGQYFVTFSALNFYVTDQVKRWAINKGLQQTPNAITHLIGDPPLVALSDAQTLLLQQILDDAPGHTTEQTTRSLVAQVGNTIQQSLQNQRPDMFNPGGLCAGRPLAPMLDRFFVAQEFRADKDDLLLALGSALQNYQLQPYRADQDIEPGHILCKIAGKIQSTLFSIFELTRTQNRNVYLELGIALGLRRAFLLVQESGAPISPLVQGLDYYHVRSYTTLKRELGDRLHNALLNIASYQRQDLPTAGATPTYILAHGNYDMPTDFCLAMAQPLTSRKLNPVLIGEDNADILKALDQEQISILTVDNAMQTRLNATVDAIQSAKFGIYRIDADCSADTFLALGIAIGLNRPWLLINRRGATIPVDVRGLSGLEFGNFGELEQEFPRRFNLLLDRYAKV